MSFSRLNNLDFLNLKYDFMVEFLKDDLYFCIFDI